MVADLTLYAELVVFLAGLLLYGFLSRELGRRPGILPGNLPLRLLLLCLAVWYGGALADEMLDLLLDPTAVPTARVPLVFALAIDVARGLAWLLSLPLLVHTLLLFGRPSSPPSTPRRILTVLPYLSLGLFIAPLLSFLRRGEPLLQAAVREVYPQVMIHASISLPWAAWLAWSLAPDWEHRRRATFLRRLAGVLLLMWGLILAGGFFDPWSTTAAGWDRALRTLFLAALLLPGILFIYFVQRYNFLRLSLSFRSLRHFLAALFLVLAVMLGGPVMGMEMSLSRRAVGWGLLVAIFLVTAYRPLADRALQSSSALRLLLGQTVNPHELDRLMAGIQSLDLDEPEALEHTARELGRWLGGRAEFLPPPTTEPADDAAAGLWRFFESRPEIAAVDRLAPPNPEIAAFLSRRGLHAAMPLRVGGGSAELTGLLALEPRELGGGYDEGEMDAVQLVLRQLAATLALRRVMEGRIAEERRLAEHEHLGTLGLVTASLAHELKNPLSSMKTLAQALREDLAAEAPDSEGVEDLDLILRQIDRLHLTAAEILGLARPPAGTETDLAALVKSSLYVLQAEARKRAVELCDDEVEEVGPVPGSAACWQTVVFNLILNAIAHTAPGERVVVRQRRCHDRLCFEVANPGVPVPPEKARRLFEPFVTEGGVGLGLTLVARRVAELGGNVEVDYEEDSSQVVFRVEVPSRAREEAA